MAGKFSSHPRQFPVLTLLKRFHLLFRRLTKILIRRLYQLLVWLSLKHRRSTTSGFVLPTTIMMLLVIMLTVSALVYRAYSHTAQVIGEAQQRVVYNAATPAIDRARAKLETLFDANRDVRYPGGVPAENVLAGMLRNDGSYNVTTLPGAPTNDIYTLPGEMRINLDGQTKTGETRGEDNAWAYRVDTNGDGANDATVLYSIILQTPPDAIATGGSNLPVPGSGVVSTSDRVKAQNLWVRTAPLSNRQRGNCGTTNTQVASAAQGWFQDLSNSSTLRKNFQIDALVIPDTATTRPNFITLEMQQDRQLDRGNKWGAWFRNDLEIFPGPAFNWNGAMHTEGSLIINPSNSFTAYLVSAQNSCLMSTPTSSEITVTNILNSTNDPQRKPDFIGGTISGTIKDNSFGGRSNIHVWPATATGPSEVATLDSTTQSANQARTPEQMSLNPIPLLTRDVSLARGANPSNRNNVAANWRGLPGTSRNPRIANQAEPKPYVDDLYRADDRWGPKPRYTDQIVLRGAAQQPGALITAGNVSAPGDLVTLTGNTPPVDNLTAVGLDGYWERRAVNEGVRVIVGQRLELGNTFGWTPAKDPLTDANDPLKMDPLYPADLSSISHAQRQRRTLRDNLAAVQASAVYHSGNPNGAGNFPVACLASTTHPGTLSAIQKSIDFRTTNRTFYQLSDPSNPNSTPIQVPLRTDFLNGSGTNGWEFSPPQGTEASFSTAIAAGQPLGRALRNLANFAGDANGAFPALQEAGRVHPYPNLTMWGNFSELRRTLVRLDSGVDYQVLSPADKTTLHTAACTLGMLAYNVDIAQKSNLNSTINGTNISNGQKVSLGEGIWQNFEGVGNRPDLFQQYCRSGDGSQSNPFQCDILPTVSPSKDDPLLKDLSDNQFTLAIQILNQGQILRDRELGFKDSPLVTANNTFDVKGTGNRHYRFRFPANCDPNNPTGNPIGAINPTGQGLDQKKAGLAMLCASKPKYPALFYLFPRIDHDQDGDSSQGNDQPTLEPYISDSYIASTVNGTAQYRVVSGSVADRDNLNGVILQPKPGNSDNDFDTNWVLPNSAPQNVAGNVSPNLIVFANGNQAATRAVGFLDRAIFNGREMMTTRVMDIDVGMLRGASSTATGGRPWLPVSGIVYAFREDAVREDGIARPASGSTTSQTNATTSPGNDPTLTTTPEGITITTKQVDYIADPDRRPHGFRLRNGSQVKRNSAFGLSNAENVRGLSFITDNPVYLQGNFNLHQTGTDNTAGALVEEFTEQMDGNYDQFYNRSTRDANFARPASDRWRPSEILADAVSILSDNFCDGSIQDTFVTPTATNYHNPNRPNDPGYGLWNPGCTGDDTSFTNQNRPLPLNTTGWRRELSGDTTNSPIVVDRNGVSFVGNAAHTSYQTFNTNKSDQWMTAPGNTRINAIIVSGIVPSRVNQSYGGLHNFPRFLENWGGQPLRFSGAFMQLNFSNYATAPFDQDSWEPGATPAGQEDIQYYAPPLRQWGYDTALQLAPAGPAASRFITANQNRNEFYTEVPISDAFINQLCTAFNAAPKNGAIAQAPATVPCP